jgi:hypothetical protein
MLAIILNFVVFCGFLLKSGRFACYVNLIDCFSTEFEYQRLKLDEIGTKSFTKSKMKIHVGFWHVPDFQKYFMHKKMKSRS